MDKRLLFSAVLAAAISANEAQAQKVTAPAFPSNPTQLKLDGTDTVYVYNVKAEKWLTNGNAYNTQASLDSVGMQVAFVRNMDGDNWNGTFTLVNNSNGSFGRKMFANSFDTDGGNAYVDYNNQGAEKCNWVVYQKGNTFELQADTISLKSDTEGTRAGWNPNDTGKDGKGDDAKCGVFRPALNMSAEGASEYGITWQAYDRETADRYFVRRYQLMPAINTAIDEALIDPSKAIAIYNNANSTAAELKAAVQYLSDMKRNLDLKDATAESPVDITQYVKDANCDALTGWTREGVYDANGNVGSGGHGTNWQIQTHAYTSEDGSFTTNKFIERWVNSGSNPDTNNEAGTGHLSDSKVYQTLTNLPAGGYKLSCWAMATQQGKGDDYQVEGVSLYADMGGKVSSKAVATKIGVPQKFEFLLAVEEGKDLTFGFKLDKTTANWVFVDEFQLEYYGSDAKVMNLMDMQSVATNLSDWMSGNSSFCPDYQEQADQLIGEAQDMQASASEEEIAAMKAKLVEIKTTIETSLAKYQALSNLIDECEQFWGGPNPVPTDAFYDLYYEGGDYGEGAESLLTTFSFDNETLDKYMVELTAALNASREQSITKGTDVTYKIVNPTYTASTGWTTTNGEVVNTTYQNCEKYQGTFNMYQDITEGLPEGVYELTAQTMARMTWNAETKTAHDNGSEVINAELYANDMSAKFASPFDAYTTEKVDNEYEYEVDGETRYSPNSMMSFQAACAANENNYLTKVKVYLEKGATLRIGVRETTRPSSNGDWCIWDNFKMTYVGNDAEALADVAAPVIANAKALYNSKMSADSLSALKAGVETLEAGDVTGNTIKALSAAIAAAQNSINAYKPLNAAIENAKLRYETNEATTTTSDAAKGYYTAALNAAQTAYDNGTVADADINEAISALNGGFTKYVINDVVGKATLTNPVDVSKAIANNDFASMDGTGWTIKEGTPGFQANNNVEAVEFYNQTFNYQQKVVGLPAGTYYLRSKAYYRMGNSTTETIGDEAKTLKYNANPNAFLYVSNNEDITKKEAKVDSVALQPIGVAIVAEENLDSYVAMSSTDGLTKFGEGYIPNTMSTAQSFFRSEQVGDNYISEPIKVIYDGKSDFYVGVFKKVSVNADWTIISNFTLQYAGPEEWTNGISGIVEDTDAVSTKIYTVNGMQISKLQKGINIIETTMKDGSKKVKKVILK